MNEPGKVVCAWCGGTIHTDRWPSPFWSWLNGSPPPIKVSHGICPACYAEQEAVLSGMAPPPAHAGKAGGEG